MSGFSIRLVFLVPKMLLHHYLSYKYEGSIDAINRAKMLKNRFHIKYEHMVLCFKILKAIQNKNKAMRCQNDKYLQDLPY